MAVPTLITAVLLIIVGVVGYSAQDPGTVSPTALIPAYFGAALALCGLLAFNDKLRKHAMHLAAMIGLFGVIGGFMPIVRQISKTGTFDPTKPAAISGILMIVICLAFVGLCVRSFIQARKARQASGIPQS